MIGGGSHVTIFARQFASMVASSLQLVSVLEDLARETPHRKLRTAVRDVAHQVSMGGDLSDAMERHPKLFNGVFVGLVRSGMETGQLAGALNHVAEYMDRVEGVSRRVTAASAYPAFILMAFLGAASAMMFFILPQYETIFATSGKPLPGPTRLLLDIGATIKSAEGALGILAAVAAVPTLAAFATRGGRAAWDRVKLRVPILGPVWRLAALARFSRTLAIQVGNQVPVVRAMQLAGAASGNRYVERLVRTIAQDIELGTSVTAAFRAQSLFAGIVLQMVAAGEEAGRLDELLLSAAAYFDTLLVQRIDTLTSLINPLMTAVLGLSIAGMMVASFLPVFDMPGAMG